MKKFSKIKIAFPLKLKNEKGVALLMVMGAITVMSALMANFIFDTHVNKIKASNQQDYLSARLMAESGLKISIARLRLYQEALNILEKDENKKKLIPTPLLNMVWSIPYMYPMILPKEANIIQRNAVEEFQKNSLLEGKLQVEIQNVSHLWNINLLRISRKINEDSLLAGGSNNNPSLPSNDDDDPFAPQNPPGNNPPPAAPVLASTNPSLEDILGLEDKLAQNWQMRMNKLRDELEDYDARYGPVTAKQLIGEIKFVVSDKDAAQDDYSNEIEARYQGITPKHAPMSSISEMNLLRGWNDEHINLFKNDLTVHGPKLIDVNKINDTGLKILIPSLTDEQAKAFFTYRDGPPRSHYFAGLKDFSDFLVNQARVVSKEYLETRINEFKKSGIDFGHTANLFKVTSTGQANDTFVKLVSYVTIPIQPPPPKPLLRPNSQGDCPQGYEVDKNNKEFCRALEEKNPDGTIKKEPLTFLAPRVVEITVQ
jgi:type II secretory pathway component PulK